MPPSVHRLLGHEPNDCCAPPLHERIRDRGPPGQDLRPDQRQHPRCDARRGPEGARRRRDARDHGPRARRGRGHDLGLRRHPDDRAREDRLDRLRLVAQGLRRPLVRRRDLDRRAVARHRPGRRHGPRGARGRNRRRRARPPGRRRPGHHVRLRDHRDQGAHAAADLARAPARRAPLRGAQERRARLPPPRRQDPGHDRLRRHDAAHGRHRRALDAARARGRRTCSCTPRSRST